jgi:hypothetical protein
MKNSIEGPIASPLFFKYLVDESKSIQQGDKRNILKKCFFLMKPANSIQCPLHLQEDGRGTTHTKPTQAGPKTEPLNTVAPLPGSCEQI